MKFLSLLSFRCAFQYVIAGIFCFSVAAARADTVPACAGSDLTTAQKALTDAKAAVNAAIADIDSGSDASAARLALWFGANSSADAQAVRANLVSASVYFNGVVFLCSVNTSIKLGDVFAYVNPDNAFAIVLGSFFFQAPDAGFDSKRGVIIHEMTHFVLVGATNDIVYGVDGAKALAASAPTSAQKNADNYEYFVEATVFGL